MEGEIVGISINVRIEYVNGTVSFTSDVVTAAIRFHPRRPTFGKDGTTSIR